MYKVKGRLTCLERPLGSEVTRKYSGPAAQQSRDPVSQSGPCLPRIWSTQQLCPWAPHSHGENAATRDSWQAWIGGGGRSRAETGDQRSASSCSLKELSYLALEMLPFFFFFRIDQEISRGKKISIPDFIYISFRVGNLGTWFKIKKV